AFVNCEFEPMIPSEFGSRSSVPLIERYNGRSFGGSSFNDRRTPRVSDCRCSEIFFTALYRNGTGTSGWSKSIKTSVPLSSEVHREGSSASPRLAVTPKLVSLSNDPCERTSALTFQPESRATRTTSDPTKPVAPNTNIVFFICTP